MYTIRGHGKLHLYKYAKAARCVDQSMTLAYTQFAQTHAYGTPVGMKTLLALY